MQCVNRKYITIDTKHVAAAFLSSRGEAIACTAAYAIPTGLYYGTIRTVYCLCTALLLVYNTLVLRYAKCFTSEV